MECNCMFYPSPAAGLCPAVLVYCSTQRWTPASICSRTLMEIACWGPYRRAEDTRKQKQAELMNNTLLFFSCSANVSLLHFKKKKPSPEPGCSQRLHKALTCESFNPLSASICYNFLSSQKKKKKSLFLCFPLSAGQSEHLQQSPDLT